MNTYQFDFTVFTPLYNRAHTIRRVYESLKVQTFKNFEWLVVDDGSTDESVSLVEEFIRENEITISLYKNSHGGKHRAVNKGISLARGRLFFLLDSDDWLLKDALKLVLQWEKKVPKDALCAGFCANMVSPQGKQISRGVTSDYIFMPLTKMIKKGVAGDHADILYTEVFKKFLYPEIAGEYHIAPGVPFIRMANAGYSLLYFNCPIYVADYGPDGLTAMGDKKSLDNFCGYTLRSSELLHSDIGMKRKAEILVKYCLLNYKKKFGVKDAAKALKIPTVIAFVGTIMGYVYQCYNQIRKYES